MKLRLCGNSVRLRLLRSEVATFLERGELEQTTQLGVEEDASFTYGLRLVPGLSSIEAHCKPGQIVVLLPTAEATAWATSSSQVGVYGSVNLGHRGTLDLIVEKDFACLDLSDEENVDTFPHPQVGTTC